MRCAIGACGVKYLRNLKNEGHLFRNTIDTLTHEKYHKCAAESIWNMQNAKEVYIHLNFRMDRCAIQLNLPDFISNKPAYADAETFALTSNVVPS